MEPILDKARAGQNALEKIANAIPGFRGYREKELRRDADRLQREFVASRLDENKKALNEMANAATRSGDLGVINDIEAVRKRLDKVAARVRYADRGYAGFFDTVKVDEAALARVYDIDLGLIQGVEAVEAAAKGSGATSVKETVAAMAAGIDALDAQMTDREAVLNGLK
jgi:hypothetical protein